MIFVERSSTSLVYHFVERLSTYFDKYIFLFFYFCIDAQKCTHNFVEYLSTIFYKKHYFC